MSDKNPALWNSTKKYNIVQNLISVIDQFYGKTSNAVLVNDFMGEWFRIVVERIS